MLNILNAVRLFPKHVAITAALTAAFLTSFGVFAAAEVKVESNLAVANFTRGDSSYNANSVDASYDETVRFKIYYHNMELPDSGKLAENLSVKVDFPTTAGATQTVTATVGGSNTNTVVDTASVNLGRSDAYLEFISGSVEWKHNVGTRDNIQYETLNLADSVVTSGAPVALEHQQPCFEYEAWVTFSAKVRVPSVDIQKVVADADEPDWSESVTSAPGEEVRYRLTAQNNGNARVSNVTVRDFLPAGMSFVNGSTKIFDSNNPNGLALPDGITTGKGINIGDLPNDTVAYITFRATMNSANSFECGLNTLVNRATVVGVGFNGDEDTANVEVNRICEQEEPVYDCSSLATTVLDSAARKINANANITATGGATLNGVSIDFGDGTVVNNNNAMHSYTSEGDYKIVAVATFNVGDEVKSAMCMDTVSFQDDVEKCEVAGKANLSKDDPNCKEDTPAELPNTGAGSAIVAIFGAITASTAGYGFVQNRRS